MSKNTESGNYRRSLSCKGKVIAHVAGVKDTGAGRYASVDDAKSADAGWRFFWSNRNVDALPSVSSHVIGGFDLPNLNAMKRATS